MARRFPTVSDFIQISSNSAFTVASGTVGGWVKNTVSVASGHNGAIFDRVSGANLGGFSLLQTGNSQFFQIAGWDTGGTLRVNITAGSVDLHDGNWHHVVYVFDTGNGATNTIYVDGGSQGSANSTAAWAMSNQPLLWGAQGQANAWTNLDETISDWFFSSVKFTAGEVAALAAGARPYNFRGIISHWPFFGLVSPEPDLSGNVHNATLSGSPALAADPPLMQFTPRWNQVREVGSASFSPAWARNRNMISAGVAT